MEAVVAAVIDINSKVCYFIIKIDQPDRQTESSRLGQAVIVENIVNFLQFFFWHFVLTCFGNILRGKYTHSNGVPSCRRHVGVNWGIPLSCLELIPLFRLVPKACNAIVTAVASGGLLIFMEEIAGKQPPPHTSAVACAWLG